MNVIADIITKTDNEKKRSVKVTIDQDGPTAQLKMAGDESHLTRIFQSFYTCIYHQKARKNIDNSETIEISNCVACKAKSIPQHIKVIEQIQLKSYYRLLLTSNSKTSFG